MADITSDFTVSSGQNLSAATVSAATLTVLDGGSADNVALEDYAAELLYGTAVSTFVDAGS